MANAEQNQFAQLALAYPCLWNPSDVNYTNEPLKAFCREQLLQKCNSMASIPVDMNALNQWLAGIRIVNVTEPKGNSLCNEMVGLLSEFKFLWDPQDPKYTNEQLRRRCQEQLLQKFNSISDRPVTMEQLMKDMQAVGNQLKQRGILVNSNEQSIISSNVALAPATVPLISQSSAALTNVQTVQPSTQRETSQSDDLLTIIDSSQSVVTNLTQNHTNTTMVVNNEQQTNRISRKNNQPNSERRGLSPHVKLFELMEEYPCLWDPNDFNSNDFVKRNECREELLDKIKMRYGRITMKTLKKKIKSFKLWVYRKSMRIGEPTCPRSPGHVQEVDILRKIFREQDIARKYAQWDFQPKELKQKNTVQSVRQNDVQNVPHIYVQQMDVQPGNAQPINVQPINAQQINVQPMNVQPIKVEQGDALQMDIQPSDVQFPLLDISQLAIPQVSAQQDPTGALRSSLFSMLQTGQQGTSPVSIAPLGVQPVVTNQAPLIQGTMITFRWCRLCGELRMGCTEVTKCKKPYLENNKIKLTLNALNVDIDFNKKALRSDVCTDCDKKLQDMYDFVTLVKGAQEKLADSLVDSTFNIKTECPSPICIDSDDSEDNTDVGNPRTFTDIEFLKNTGNHKRKSDTGDDEQRKKSKVDINPSLPILTVHDNMDIHMKGKSEMVSASTKIKTETLTVDKNTNSIENNIEVYKKAIEDTLKETQTDNNIPGDTQLDEGNEMLLTKIKQENETVSEVISENNESDLISKNIVSDLPDASEKVKGMPKKDLVLLVESIVSRMLKNR